MIRRTKLQRRLHKVEYRTAIVMLVIAVTLAGCASSRFKATLDDYQKTWPSIKLGMSKHEVEAILSPSQRLLTITDRKQPDHYMEDGVLVDILYFRSGWHDDGLTTDDEFTPYVFHNDKLVAIGWHILGGPKSQGQARDAVYINNTSSTNVVRY